MGFSELHLSFLVVRFLSLPTSGRVYLFFLPVFAHIPLLDGFLCFFTYIALLDGYGFLLPLFLLTGFFILRLRFLVSLFAHF